MSTTNLDKALEGFETIRKQFEQAKKTVMKPLRAALLADFKAAMEKHPEVTAIRWTQYTPYFNDGDPCVFRINELYVLDEDDEELYPFEGWDDFPQPDSIDDDMMEAVFGDHVEVTLRRGADDFDIDDYRHD